MSCHSYHLDRSAVTEAVESRQQVPHSARCLRKLWILFRDEVPTRRVRELRVAHPDRDDRRLVQEG